MEVKQNSSFIKRRILQCGAQPTDSLCHTTIFYTTTKGRNDIRKFYLQSKKFIICLLLLIDNVLKVASSICSTMLQRFKKTVTKSVQQLLICDWKFIPKRAFQLLYCVWAIPVQIFLEVSLQDEIRDHQVRRPCRPWDTR